jgi:hypothetical protein
MVVVSREEVHRLVDAVPEARLPVLEQVLLASLGVPPKPFGMACPFPADAESIELCEDLVYED